MKNIKEILELGRKINQQRNRHSSHNVGDELYYHCKDLEDYRRGVVYAIVEHEGMKHYVLEVSCHIGEFLVLQSQYQVKTRERN